ncbi:MAG: hypothetical protein OXB92_07830 [Acidimicrobiaceae bacterium]|nr:hypothetical protein [Acidimicrobiia bacterium]MCY4493747.1 hypothetical protein [Acidimicrobiaceae bacterium]
MQETRTEALCRIGIEHRDDGGTRPLTYEELCEFVSDFADHLIDDERTIDPVVSGDAGAGEIKVVFGLARPIGDRDTDVEVFDIVYDAGSALGAEWTNDSKHESPRRRAPSVSTMLSRQSQRIADAGLVDA